MSVQPEFVFFLNDPDQFLPTPVKHFELYGLWNVESRYTHLLFLRRNTAFDSKVTFSQFSASSSSSESCTSRLIWRGEEGQGEAAEEPWAGESWEQEEEEVLWLSSSDRFSDQEDTSCWRSLIFSKTLSRAEKTSSPASTRLTWER